MCIKRVCIVPVELVGVYVKMDMKTRRPHRLSRLERPEVAHRASLSVEIAHEVRVPMRGYLVEINVGIQFCISTKDALANGGHDLHNLSV